MKPLAELDHYEVLEIEPDAGADEIERAYHVARSAYAEGSLATYSVFGERDTEALRHRIELAYRTLSEPHARRAYDASLGGFAPPEPAPDLSAHDPLLDAVTRRLVDEEALPATSRGAGSARGGPPPDLERWQDLDPEEQSGPCDGAKLRRAREKRGLEIDQIAAVTKINPMYLRLLEDDALDQLPAPVYVRGFVKAFARCVGLDPNAAASTYLARFEAAPPKKRTRVFGRQPAP